MAQITDLLTQATNTSRPAPTTLTAIKGIGASSISCGTLTGWPTTTAVHFVLYTIDTTGAKVAGSQTDWKGIVSGSTITNLTLKAGSDTSYSIGTVVEATPTAAWANDVVAWGTAQHNQDGTHNSSLVALVSGAQTLTGKTLTAPVIADFSAAGHNHSNTVNGGLTVNPYKFSAYGAVSTVIVLNAWSKITINTKEYDTGTNFDAVTNYRFTAPVAGFYQFFGAYQVTAGGAGETYDISFYKNNNILKEGTKVFSSAAGTLNLIVSPPPFQLAANDYIELFGFNGTAGGKTVSAGQNVTYFGGFLVST